MRRFTVTAIAAALLAVLAPGSAALAAITSVSPEEAATWTRYTVPLPKQMQITGKVSAQCNKVSVVLPASSDIKVPQARKELREALGLPGTGDNPVSPDFTIILQLGGTEASSLNSLANSGQAYKIFPESNNAGLRLVALEPAGLYYAAKTLQLMLIPKVSGGIVQIPMIEVLDWPDMADRGLWGSDHYLWLRWMADRKLNIGEQIAYRWVTSDGVGHQEPKAGREVMHTEGPYYGVQPVHVTLHLEQVYGSGLFTYYPQVIGVGGRYGAICYSNGAFTQVLADWIYDLARLPNVDGVDVWMTENLQGQGGCDCSQCKLVNNMVLEAQIIAEAWERAKTRLGRYFNLWILTSEETYNSNSAIFAAIPSDVRVWYYHSLYTYTSGRAPMIPSNVQNLANSGRYAGVCPSLSSIGSPQPFTSAEFVNYRASEFVSKNLRGVLGYATPAPIPSFNGYNVEALAEWSWNVSGRSVREFAASYAVRKGYPDPEKFADWADANGNLQFDLQGSEWPSCEGKFWPGYVADLLQRGALPSLGTAYAGARGPWGEFKTAQHLDNSVLLSARALAIAREMGINEHYYESLYADGLVTSLKALYKLRGLVVGGTVSSQNREVARFWFGVYINSIKQAMAAAQQWSIAVNGESSSVQTVVNKLNQCIYGLPGTPNIGMLQVATDANCVPNLPYNVEPAMSIADAKRLGDGATVKLYGNVVSGGGDGTYFVQEPNRSAAIRVSSSAPLTVGAASSLFGIVKNVNGELVVNAEVAQTSGSVEATAPVAMPLRSLGGGAFGAQPALKEYRDGQAVPVGGLNNLGLYVKTTGFVTFVGSDHFYIDDGSGCNDGSGHLGVKAICADPAWSKPPVGEFVTLIGMSSTYFDRGQNWRALYLPSSANVVVVPVSLDIIVDEDEAALTGGWTYVSSADGAYNNDYSSATASSVPTATATWTPAIGRPGVYDVYVMHSEGPDRTTAAQYTVVYDGGSASGTVDQTIGGGDWQHIGAYFFAAGATGYVRLTNQTADPGSTVVADAVRFSRRSGGTPPSVASQPANQAVCAGSNVVISIAATGTTPLSYQWRKGTTNIVDGGRYSGATTQSLTITGCDMADAATNYNCVVTNLYGSIHSDNAALVIGDASLVPAALPASAIGNDRITWNWGSVAGATGYKLWTAATGGTQVGGTITDTSYSELGLAPITAYTRYVEVLSGCGASTTRTQLGPTSTLPRYCVENGDFESGFTGGVGNYWVKGEDDGTSTFARETTIKRDGTSSQKLVDPVGGQAFTAWLYQRVNVQPNRGYTYRVYNRREVTGGCVVRLGVNYTGGTTPNVTSDTMGSGAGVWSLKSVNFTSGSTGIVTVMFCAGQNSNNTTAYIDGVYLLPQSPTSSGGSTTISPGGTATITASGGFNGASSDLHWYTGPNGTGTHVGAGTSLMVNPTVTTTYYPRWESSPCLGSCCASGDGPTVTITVN